VGPCMFQPKERARHITGFTPADSIIRNDKNMDNGAILLDHGSGGKISHNLISKIMIPCFNDSVLAKLDDGAVLDMEEGKIAFSTDTYVVDPIFFPGGDIGDLAINGTVNDISVAGGRPRWISLALILEEGLPFEIISAAAGKDDEIRVKYTRQLQVGQKWWLMGLMIPILPVAPANWK